MLYFTQVIHWIILNIFKINLKLTSLGFLIQKEKDISKQVSTGPTAVNKTLLAADANPQRFMN